MATRLLICCWLATLLIGCATPPQSAAVLQDATLAVPPAASVSDLPFFAQDAYQCGPAALAMLLQHSGVALTPQQLVPQVYVPGRKGSFQIEMTAAARAQARLVYTLEPQLHALLQEVAAGNPVLVLQNLGLDWLPRWHFAVVKGYDLHAGELLLNSGRIENYRVKLTTFERTWARGGHWAQVVLAPDRLPATAEPGPLFNALAALQETGQHAAADLGFTTALQRWPDDSTLLLGAGNLHYALGRTAEAGAAFHRITQLQPDHAAAHNNLAQVLLEQGLHQEALGHARQAVALGGRFGAQYQATLDDIQAATRKQQFRFR